MKELCLYMILILNAQLTIAQEAIRPWIGVQIEHSMLGVLIENTYPDTPAARAGLSTGDTIILIDGEKVSTPKELIELVAQKGVGNKVTLTYIDNSGSEKETQLELEVMPGMSKLAEKKLLNKSLPKFDLNILSK
jgi:S1-C subfamily serine protease